MRPSRVAVAAGILALAVLRLALTPAVLPNDYPFTMNDDSWALISQALRFLGGDYPSSARPPLYSAVIAVLYALGLEQGVGIVTQAASLVGIAATSYVAQRLAGTRTAVLTALFMLVNKHFFLFACHLNPDIMHASLVAAAIALLLAGGRTTGFLAWIVMSAAMLTHHNPASAASFIAVFAVTRRERTLHPALIAAGAAVFACLGAAYYLTPSFRTTFSTVYAQDLTVNDPGFVARYILYILFSFSLPGAALLVTGLSRNLRSRSMLVLAAWCLPSLLFFVLFWKTYSGRWFFYFNFPLFIVCALGFETVIERAGRRLAMLLLAVTLVYMNSSSAGSMLDYSSRFTLVVPPWFVIVTDDHASLPQDDADLAFRYFATHSADEMRRTVARNIFSPDVKRTAELLHAALGPADAYAVVPLTVPVRGKLLTRLQVLSGRKYREVSPSNPDDPALKAVVAMNIPAPGSPDDPEIAEINTDLRPERLVPGRLALEQITRSDAFRKERVSDVIDVYIRR